MRVQIKGKVRCKVRIMMGVGAQAPQNKKAGVLGLGVVKGQCQCQGRCQG